MTTKTSATKPSAVGRQGYASQLVKRDLLITGSRLLLVPPLVLTLNRAPLVTAGLLGVFVAIDYLDGVIARRADADQVARRLLDTAVDRTAIHVCLLAAVFSDLLPLVFWGAFVTREAVAGRLLAGLLRRHGVVIRADRLYRGFNLSIAAWGALAPLLSASGRGFAFGFVLFMGAVVLVDIQRACSLPKRGALPDTGVVRAGDLRRAFASTRPAGTAAPSPLGASANGAR